MSIYQKIIIAFFGLIGSYLSLSGSGNVFGAGTVSLISYPDQVEIGEEFAVYFRVEGLEANTSHHKKGRVGQGAYLNDGETFNPTTSAWLPDSGSSGKWEYFPTFTTNNEGSASANLQMRIKSSAQLGENILEISILKVGEDSRKKVSSNPGRITVLAAPTLTPTPNPSSTPTPSVISTPTPTRQPTSTPTPTPLPLSTITPSIKPTVTPTKRLTASPTPSLFPVTEEEILGVQASASLPPKTPSSLPKILIGVGTFLLVISGGLLFLPHLKR